MDDKLKLYTLEDLTIVAANYADSKKKYDDHMRMVHAKKREQESFQRDADAEWVNVERHKAELKCILKNLET